MLYPAVSAFIGSDRFSILKAGLGAEAAESCDARIEIEPLKSAAAIEDAQTLGTHGVPRVCFDEQHAPALGVYRRMRDA